MYFRIILQKPEGGMPSIPPSVRFTWETSRRNRNCCCSHCCSHSRNRRHSYCHSHSHSRSHNRNHSRSCQTHCHRRSSSTER